MPPDPRPKRKRFGQHFLHDRGYVDRIVKAISPRENDIVVEIGPGGGVLTKPLSTQAGRLIAVEIDRDLAAHLRHVFASNDNVSIVEADALAIDFANFGERLRVVGNLPYNISTPLLFRLTAQRQYVSDAVFMLQKEVVDRIVA
ncbi:MAG: rRNA adenine dimethyltransferase family protein, partial [Pseudomonadota bacterium]